MLAERSAVDGEETWRTTEEDQKLSLAVSDAGMRAVGVEPDKPSAVDTTPSTPRMPQAGEPASKPAPSKPKPASKPTIKSKSKTRKSPPLAPATSKSGTKLSILTTALRAKRGATIDELTSRTGWQAHSVRGSISGALEKKLGLEVISEIVAGRGRVCRIAQSAGK